MPVALLLPAELAAPGSELAPQTVSLVLLHALSVTWPTPHWVHETQAALVDVLQGRR